MKFHCFTILSAIAFEGCSNDDELVHSSPQINHVQKIPNGRVHSSPQTNHVSRVSDDDSLEDDWSEDDTTEETSEESTTSSDDPSSSETSSDSPIIPTTFTSNDGISLLPQLDLFLDTSLGAMSPGHTPAIHHEPPVAITEPVLNEFRGLIGLHESLKKSTAPHLTMIRGCHPFGADSRNLCVRVFMYNCQVGIDGFVATDDAETQRLGCMNFVSNLIRQPVNPWFDPAGQFYSETYPVLINQAGTAPEIVTDDLSRQITASPDIGSAITRILSWVIADSKIFVAVDIDTVFWTDGESAGTALTHQFSQRRVLRRPRPTPPRVPPTVGAGHSLNRLVQFLSYASNEIISTRGTLRPIDVAGRMIVPPSGSITDVLPDASRDELLRLEERTAPIMFHRYPRRTHIFGCLEIPNRGGFCLKAFIFHCDRQVTEDLSRPLPLATECVVSGTEAAGNGQLQVWQGAVGVEAPVITALDPGEALDIFRQFPSFHQAMDYGISQILFTALFNDMTRAQHLIAGRIPFVTIPDRIPVAVSVDFISWTLGAPPAPSVREHFIGSHSFARLIIADPPAPAPTVYDQSLLVDVVANQYNDGLMSDDVDPTVVRVEHCQAIPTPPTQDEANHLRDMIRSNVGLRYSANTARTRIWGNIGRNFALVLEVFHFVNTVETTVIRDETIQSLYDYDHPEVGSRFTVPFDGPEAALDVAGIIEEESPLAEDGQLNLNLVNSIIQFVTNQNHEPFNRQIVPIAYSIRILFGPSDARGMLDILRSRIAGWSRRLILSPNALGVLPQADRDAIAPIPRSQFTAFDYSVSESLLRNQQSIDRVEYAAEVSRTLRPGMLETLRAVVAEQPPLSYTSNGVMTQVTGCVGGIGTPQQLCMATNIFHSIPPHYLAESFYNSFDGIVTSIGDYRQFFSIGGRFYRESRQTRFRGNINTPDPFDNNIAHLVNHIVHQLYQGEDRIHNREIPVVVVGIEIAYRIAAEGIDQASFIRIQPRPENERQFITESFHPVFQTAVGLQPEEFPQGAPRPDVRVIDLLRVIDLETGNLVPSETLSDFIVHDHIRIDKENLLFEKDCLEVLNSPGQYSCEILTSFRSSKHLIYGPSLESLLYSINHDLVATIRHFSKGPGRPADSESRLIAVSRTSVRGPTEQVEGGQVRFVADQMQVTDRPYLMYIEFPRLLIPPIRDEAVSGNIASQIDTGFENFLRRFGISNHHPITEELTDEPMMDEFGFVVNPTRYRAAPVGFFITRSEDFVIIRGCWDRVCYHINALVVPNDGSAIDNIDALTDPRSARPLLRFMKNKREALASVDDVAIDEPRLTGSTLDELLPLLLESLRQPDRIVAAIQSVVAIEQDLEFYTPYSRLYRIVKDPEEVAPRPPSTVVLHNVLRALRRRGRPSSARVGKTGGSASLPQVTSHTLAQMMARGSGGVTRSTRDMTIDSLRRILRHERETTHGGSTLVDDQLDQSEEFESDTSMFDDGGESVEKTLLEFFLDHSGGLDRKQVSIRQGPGPISILGEPNSLTDLYALYSLSDNRNPFEAPKRVMAYHWPQSINVRGCLESRNERSAKLLVCFSVNILLQTRPPGESMDEIRLSQSAFGYISAKSKTQYTELKMPYFVWAKGREQGLPAEFSPQHITSPLATVIRAMNWGYAEWQTTYGWSHAAITGINFDCDVLPIDDRTDPGTLGQPEHLPSLYVVHKLPEINGRRRLQEDDLINFARGHVETRFISERKNVEIPIAVKSDTASSGKTLLLDGSVGQIATDLNDLFDEYHNLRDSHRQLTADMSSNRSRIAGCYVFRGATTPVCVNILIFRKDYRVKLDELTDLESIQTEAGGSSSTNRLFQSFRISYPLRVFDDSKDNKVLETSLSRSHSLQESLDSILIWAEGRNFFYPNFYLGIHITASILQDDGTVETVGPVFARLAIDDNPPVVPAPKAPSPIPEVVAPLSEESETVESKESETVESQESFEPLLGEAIAPPLDDLASLTSLQLALDATHQVEQNDLLETFVTESDSADFLEYSSSDSEGSEVSRDGSLVESSEGPEGGEEELSVSSGEEKGSPAVVISPQSPPSPIETVLMNFFAAHSDIKKEHVNVFNPGPGAINRAGSSVSLSGLYKDYPPIQNPQKPLSVTVQVSCTPHYIYTRGCLKATGGEKQLVCFMANIVFGNDPRNEEEVRLAQSPSGYISTRSGEGGQPQTSEFQWNVADQNQIPNGFKNNQITNQIDTIARALNWAFDFYTSKFGYSGKVSAINFAADVSPIIPPVNSGDIVRLGTPVHLPSLYLVQNLVHTDYRDDLINFSTGHVFAKYRGPASRYHAFGVQVVAIPSKKSTSGEVLLFDGKLGSIETNYPIRSGAVFDETGHVKDAKYNLFVKTAPTRIRVGGCYTFNAVPVCVNMLILRRTELLSYDDLSEFMRNLASIESEVGDSSGNDLFSSELSTGVVRKFGSSDADKQLSESLSRCVSLQDSLDRVLLWALEGDEQRGSVILGIHITASIRMEDGSVETVGPVYARLARQEDV